MSMEISGKESEVQAVPSNAQNIAYSSGQLIGSLLTFTNAFGVKQSGILHGLVIRDKGSPAPQQCQLAELSLVFFKSQPTGTFTDQTTFNPSAADFALIQGHVNIRASHYMTFSAGARGIATVAAIGLPLRSNDTNLYAVLMSRGTPTYAGQTAIAVVPKILLD